MKYLLFFFCICMTACSQDTPSSQNQSQKPIYEVMHTYPHSTESFTEGLFWHENILFESTAGLSEYPGTKSEFGIVNLKTGNIESKARLDENIYFGEGITLLDDVLYQVTYKNQKGFIYNTKTWEKIGEFDYENSEGWGLTNDGKHIIMSDGTDTLTFFEPENMTKIRTLQVTKNETAIENINELEYVDGYIFANIWLTNTIVKIHENTGEIIKTYDFSSLVKAEKANNFRALEMNGIAYNSEKGTFWITGKFWENIYEVVIFEEAMY